MEQNRKRLAGNATTKTNRLGRQADSTSPELEKAFINKATGDYKEGALLKNFQKFVFGRPNGTNRA